MDKKVTFWNIANLITLSRILLLFVASYLLFQGAKGKITAFFLILLIIFMDLLDGYFARKFKVDSEFGGVFDITGDRIVENVLWVVFSYLGLIPLWIPIVVLTRGFITDAIRSHASTKGMTAFGEKSMMKGYITTFLVSSRTVRFGYGVLKFLSFSFLAIVLIIKENNNLILTKAWITILTNVFVYSTVTLCLIRGIAVIKDGMILFKE